MIKLYLWVEEQLKLSKIAFKDLFKNSFKAYDWENDTYEYPWKLMKKWKNKK